MDTLDSRSLRYLDCFAQKFSVVGHVHYRLVTTAGACLPVEDRKTFTIDVNENKTARNKQHNVIIRLEGSRLVADPDHLEIEAGDMVLWHAPNTSTPGFTVRGEGPNFTFDSTELTSEAVYTHAFGTPGNYAWIDANDRQVSGVVEVQSLDPHNKKECKRWLAALKNGTLVTINDNTVKPARVQILTGQTVFWAIERASGITITDARLVQ